VTGLELAEICQQSHMRVMGCNIGIQVQYSGQILRFSYVGSVFRFGYSGLGIQVQFEVWSSGY